LTEWTKWDDVKAWSLLIGWYGFVALIIIKGMLEHGII
jgi:hypothetical protein